VASGRKTEAPKEILMEKESIPTGRSLFTKTQRERIGRLGAEWSVLDSEENQIFRLMRELYEKLGPDEKRPPELVELEQQQTEIFRRKREITADLIAVEEGNSNPTQRSGRRPDFYVELRDRWIRRLRDLSNEEICKRLDFDLARSDAPPFGFPESWKETYGVEGYLTAYQHRGCKQLVQRLISGAKKRY
jgi:hypothetical protein